MSKLSIQPEGDNQLVCTRCFDAPPESVFHAHIEPELIQQWMLGPEGWTMPVCLSDARPGGKMRFEWTNAEGTRFYLTGEYVALDPGRRIDHIERMHLPDPFPDNRVETTFTPEREGTLLTVRITVPDAETRTRMLASGMELGMEASYARLDSMGSDEEG